MIGIFGSLIRPKTLMQLTFNSCSEFRRAHSHFHVGAPGIFSDLLRSVQMLNGEFGAESNGELPHLFILGKTAALVPEFAVEDLPLAEL